MRIALCFIGLPRFIKENNSIRENLISQNENVDIFVHTWGDGDEGLKTIETIYDTYGANVKKIKLEPPKKFKECKKDFDKLPDGSGHVSNNKDIFCSYFY